MTPAANEPSTDPTGGHIPLGAWNELYEQMFQWREDLGAAQMQEPPTIQVKALADPWQPSNPSCALTPDGVTMGPYADGAAVGGSLRYLGLNGQPFRAVQSLAYLARYTSDDKNLEPGAAPYLRVFTQDADGGAHDAIFTPGSQPYPLPAGPFQEWVATAGAWRWDDDAGTGGVPLGELQAQYGDQTITKLGITTGWTAGANLAGLLLRWQINGTFYYFAGAGA